MATTKTKKFPEVQGGGSLMVAWQLKGKKVLVVGGGEVAAGRILHCLNADAQVTVVSPSSGLCPEVAHRVSLGQVRHVDHKFEASDLEIALSSSLSESVALVHTVADLSNDDSADDTTIPPAPPTLATQPTATLYDMVLVAIEDAAASTEIWQHCHARRIPANIADVPSECDFFFGSVHRDGPLQVMVSTNGRGPRLAAQVRRWIAAGLPRGAGGAAERVGGLRSRLRKLAPGQEDGPKRMEWMTKVSDAYSWEDIGQLTDEDMDNLLKFYPSGQVPQTSDLQAMREEAPAKFDVFDGSFGFCVGA